MLAAQLKKATSTLMWLSQNAELIRKVSR